MPCALNVYTVHAYQVVDYCQHTENISNLFKFMGFRQTITTAKKYAHSAAVVRDEDQSDDKMFMKLVHRMKKSIYDSIPQNSHKNAAKIDKNDLSKRPALLFFCVHTFIAQLLELAAGAFTKRREENLSTHTRKKESL